MNVYCHADAAEQATWFGDDIRLKADVLELLGMNTAQVISLMMRRIGSHGTGLQRVKRLATFPVKGRQEVVGFLTTHTLLGGQFAENLGLDPAVQDAIHQAYEQWDGNGHPRPPSRRRDLPARAAGAIRRRRRGAQPPSRPSRGAAGGPETPRDELRSRRR